ncbi:Crp/Fnr family transcriptional regulator [Ornithinimicrobium sp. W1665]|uniref:Crp/Fnr family transcriptional regulator n=1 Tax=Ornithinimicrobium sp. W1665 TaxID=3416666 RepID=UPI003CEF9222
MPTRPDTGAGRPGDRRSLPVHQDDLCVARVPLFSGLTRAEQEQVATVARPTRLGTDEVVYTAGQDVSQLLVVHTGRVKISRVTADGHEQIVRVLGPGDFVGESAFLDGGRPDHAASAVETTSLCVFRHQELHELVARHPSIGLRMLQTLSRRLSQTEERLGAAISTDVSARLADHLLSLPGRRTDDGLQVELPLAKKDVASLLDTTPESLSRQLRRLSDSGLVALGPGRRITLLDVDALLTMGGQG